MVWQPLNRGVEYFLCGEVMLFLCKSFHAYSRLIADASRHNPTTQFYSRSSAPLEEIITPFFFVSPYY